MLRLLAIDGLNLIRRIYAVQEQQFSDQQNEKLLHTVINQCSTALNKMLTQFTPTHAVVVFDGEKANWRNQLYPEYKANRKAMPELLAKHLDDIQQAFWHLGVDSLLAESDEADDLIATLVGKLPQDRGEAIIVSTDKDYLQLLTQPNVKIWHYFERKWLDNEHVSGKYNLNPEQLADYFALCGDNGHNISGIAKVGNKTAQSLLAQQLELAELLKSERLQKYNYDSNQILLFKLLFSLKKDIQLSFHLRDIRYNPAG